MALESCNALEASANRAHSVAEYRETPGGNAMETARIEELLERLIDKISDLLQEVQDIRAEITSTNAEVIQSLLKIQQSVRNE
jgi:hypothetical protein